MTGRKRPSKRHYLLLKGTLLLALVGGQTACIPSSTQVNMQTTVKSDPGNHRLFIGLGGLIVVTVRESSDPPPFSGADDMWEVTGGAPFVNVSGPLMKNGNFNMTGSGTVAGVPNVAVSFSGNVNTTGAVSGDYTMGVGGELPGGQPITYGLTGQYPILAGTPMIKTIPSFMGFYAEPGGSAPDQNLRVKNAGDGALGWFPEVLAGDWLSVGSVGGQAPGETPVRVDSTGLAKGNYEGEIGINGLPEGGVPNSPWRVRVEFAIGMPYFNRNGIVDGAGFKARAPVAAGSIAAGFGEDFSAVTLSSATLPLPDTLGDTSIRFGANISPLRRSPSTSHLTVPLFFVSPQQMNFQVPWEAEGETEMVLTAQVGADTSFSRTVPLAMHAPGIFTITGEGQGAVLIAASGELVAPVGSIPGRITRPAAAGEFVSIFCTGLGPVSNRPASGAAAGADPLSETTSTPEVSIGGAPATVNFSGLAPDFVGLYQVNAQVPAGTTAGSAVPLSLTIGGVTSNTVTIAVQ